jgi:hypothetical protein
MVEVGVDIDAIGRKELQALAKNFGIKANQKSVVLRDKLRETIAVLKHDEDVNDNDGEEMANEKTPTNAGNEKEKIVKDDTDRSIEAKEQIGSRTEEESSHEAIINYEPFKENKASDANTPDKKYSIVTENSHDDAKREKPEASTEDISIVCVTKEQNEGHCSVDIDIAECTSLPSSVCEGKEVENVKDGISIVDEDTKVIIEQNEKDENIERKNISAADHIITKKDTKKDELRVVRDNGSKINEEATITTEENEKDHTVEASKIKAFATNSKETKNEYADNEVAIEDDIPIEEDRSTIAIEKDDGFGKEIEQEILTKKKLSPQPNDKVLLSTKTSLGTERDSVQKCCRSNRHKDEKFTSKLDELHRKNKGMKQHTKSPLKGLNQPAEERLKTSTVNEQKEVPLWKVHSRDFRRNIGADKTRDSRLKKKNHLSTKDMKISPFRDRLNNKAEVNVTTNKGDKGNIKKITPKPLPMSKRNEEQMKKFLERQSVGRKDRAKREQVKMYANCARN